MRVGSRRIVVLYTLLMACLLCTRERCAAQEQPKEHRAVPLEGWTVQVDERLFSPKEEELGKRALRLLSIQLFQIKERLPGDKVKRLQQVTIWLDRTCGDLQRPQYHPGKEWLVEHGFPGTLVKGVHIPDAVYFASANFQRHQPFATLHELAHAYHDQVLSFDNTEIKAAWSAFSEKLKDKTVLRSSGKQEKHYATTNPQEFFAEMTETYFGVNDYYPFIRSELQRDEPEIAALIDRIWGDKP